MRDIHLMEIKPLDSGLLSGEWRLDVGRTTLMWLIFLVVLDGICEKNSGNEAEYVPLKHYTFPRTLKNRGNIVYEW